MGLDTATPAAPPAPADGTPTPEGTTPEAPEQAAPPPAPEPRADTPPAVDPLRIQQAEFTRASQAYAALRDELGLDKKASREDVLAAVAALRQRAEAAPAVDDEDAEPEPELSEREKAALERAYQAEYRVAQAVYGEDFAKEAVELANVLRTADSLEEVLTAAAAFRDRFTVQPDTGDEPGAQGQPTPPGPGDIGLSEGEGSPAATRIDQQPSGAHGRESGAVTAVRGIFRAAREAASRS